MSCYWGSVVGVGAAVDYLTSGNGLTSVALTTDAISVDSMSNLYVLVELPTSRVTTILRAFFPSVGNDLGKRRRTPERVVERASTACASRLR